jgi:Fic family protein
MPLHLEQLERLSAEWKRLQPLPAELDKKLWEKLRLDWNYNSNHLEGNTLTYKETELYLLRGQTSGVHVEREYTEMKGHDVAIAIVRDLAKSPEELTEADIRNLNQILLKQSFYKDAITPDGKPSRKEIIPGRYKIGPNSVVTPTGQIFKYAEPMDVPARMAKLVEAIRKGAEKEGLEFLATLAVTHHEFTLIHPFDDGNGRVARLVTNYVLLKKGWPPIVIPSVRKADYLKALGQADAGDPALLADFFAEQLLWSLEIGIKAAKGESLEEPSDVDKEIALFVSEQKNQQKSVLKKNPEVVHQLLTTSVKLLFEKFDEKTKTIGEMFESRTLQTSSNPAYGGNSWQTSLNTMASVKDAAALGFIALNLHLKGYRGTALHPFSISQAIVVQLNDYEYMVSIYGRQAHHAIYSDALTAELVDKIVADFLKRLLEQIKQQAQQ